MIRPISGGSGAERIVLRQNDLAYGPSNGGVGGPADMVRAAGGRQLNDLAKPPEMGWNDFSAQVLDQTARSGGRTHFDLTNMDDVPGVLAGTAYRNATTSIELRHIMNNWTQFDGHVTFWNNVTITTGGAFGFKVPPPWIGGMK